MIFFSTVLLVGDLLGTAQAFTTCNALGYTQCPPDGDDIEESRQCDYPGEGANPDPQGCPSSYYCTNPVDEDGNPIDTMGVPCCLPCDYTTNKDGVECNEDWEECCFNEEHAQYICNGVIKGPYGLDTPLECRKISGVMRCRPTGCGVPDETGPYDGINGNAGCCQNAIHCDDGNNCTPLAIGDTGNCFGAWSDYGTPDNPYTNPDNWLKIATYTGPYISNVTSLLSPVFKVLFYAGIFVGILGIIYSGYLFISSEGDPGRVKEGKEQFTAAILGSLFVLLSVFILRVIINNILGIPNSGL